MSYSGIYRGIVTSIADFAAPVYQLGVSVPSITGTDSIHALPCFADPASVTTPATPSLGEGVWVMFENGDIAYPVWIGYYGRTG